MSIHQIIARCQPRRSHKSCLLLHKNECLHRFDDCNMRQAMRTTWTDLHIQSYPLPPFGCSLIVRHA
jgi:hypothetical protein